MRRAWSVPLLVLLALSSACDDDGGGDKAEFCEKAVEIGLTGEAADLDEPDRIAEELDDVAPGEIEDDLEVLREASEDPQPEDAERVIEAVGAVTDYLVRECRVVSTQ